MLSPLSFSAPFRSLGRCRSLVSCSCCSSVGFRLGLGFCISCGWVRCLLPVLLFAGLALSSCSRRVAPPPCQVLELPAQVQVASGSLLISFPAGQGELVGLGGIAGEEFQSVPVPQGVLAVSGSLVLPCPGWLSQPWAASASWSVSVQVCR